jgi:Putative DNA-binding domain
LDASKLTAPSLVELQRWLRWILTDPRGVGAALSMESGTVEDSWIEPEPLPRHLPAVVGTPLASNADRIGIYASGYFWRLFEALAADFPSVQQALGPEAFQGLVAEYLVKHPSRSPNLADLGSALPGFVHQHGLRSELPFLPDLASLEWNVHLALLSPRARFSGLPTEEREDWGSLRLRLDPTVRLLTTEWAVAPFWRSTRAGKSGSGRPSDVCHRSCGLPQDSWQTCVRPRRRRQWLLVYRDEIWVRIRALARHQWSALLRLQQGCPLGWVCEQLGDEAPRNASSDRIGDWFRDWMARGLIADSY